MLKYRTLAGHHRNCMRIYYQMSEIKVGSGRLGEVLSNYAYKTHILILEKLRNKIALVLHPLEGEMNSSEGCIIMESDSLVGGIQVFSKGFSGALVEKINLLLRAKKIDFLGDKQQKPKPDIMN